MRTESQHHRAPDRRSRQQLTQCLGALLGLAIALLPLPGTAQVYRWVDEDGVTHLSTEKPPAGVKAERIEIQRSSSTKRTTSNSTSSRSSGSNRPAPAPATPEQVASREDLLGRLKTRECVIALEALDRLTSGAQPTSAREITRLKQTADANCSTDPARRHEQEQMAAKLRVTNGPECVKARNELADMLSGKTPASAERKRAQQSFVDEHCVPPVQ